MLGRNWYVILALGILFVALVIVVLAKMMRPRETLAPKIRSAPPKRESEHQS